MVKVKQYTVADIEQLRRARRIGRGGFTETKKTQKFTPEETT